MKNYKIDGTNFDVKFYDSSEPCIVVPGWPIETPEEARAVAKALLLAAADLEIYLGEMVRTIAGR